MKKVIRFSRRVADRSGAAAVEFALLLPVLFTLFVGAYETSGLLLAYLKLEAAAETAADIVSQADVNVVLQSADFTNITSAVQQVMTPLSTSGLQIAYASVTYSTGTPVVNWHTEVNGATAIAVGSLPNSVSTASLGSQVSGSNDSVIVIQLTYPYNSPLSSYLSTNYTLRESAFNRPRYVTCVPSYLNTNTDGLGNKICP